MHTTSIMSLHYLVKQISKNKQKICRLAEGLGRFLTYLTEMLNINYCVENVYKCLHIAKE